jgi:hypothetical protein
MPLLSRKATTSRAIASSFEEKQTKTWEAAKAFSVVRDYRYTRYHGDVSRLSQLLASYSTHSLFVVLAVRELPPHRRNARDIRSVSGQGNFLKKS